MTLANVRLAVIFCFGVTSAGALAGCGGDGNPRATAMLMPATGQVVHGLATFEQTGGVVTLTVSVEQGALGVHGLHIHAGKECGTDGKLAGVTWNPDDKVHGQPGTPDSQAGDIGNVVVGSDGKGELTEPFSSSKWNIGKGDMFDIVGHPLVLDELKDDFTLMTNPGARQACGMIVLAK